MTSRRNFLKLSSMAVLYPLGTKALSPDAPVRKSPFRFVLYDEFKKGRLSALRECDGIGALKVIDSAARLTMRRGALHASGTEGRGDPLVYDPTPHPRVPGLAYMAAHVSHQCRSEGSNSDIRYGFHDRNPERLNPNYLVWIEMHDATGHCVGSSGRVPFGNEVTILGEEYKYGIVIGDPYVYFVRKIGNGEWLLAPPVGNQPATQFYALRGSDIGADNWDSETRFIKVCNLAEAGYPAWAQPFGPYVSYLSGVSAGQIIPHPGQATLSFEVDRKLGPTVVRFRGNSPNNCYELFIPDLSGTQVILTQIINGRPYSTVPSFSRLPYAIDHICIWLDGSEIRVVVDNYTHLRVADSRGDPANEIANQFEFVQTAAGAVRHAAIYEVHLSGEAADSLDGMEQAKCQRW